MGVQLTPLGLRVAAQAEVMGRAAAEAVDAVSGLGLPLLPCFLGDAAPELERVSGVKPLEKPIWLVRNRQAASTARVIAVWSFLHSLLSTHARALAGR